MGRSLDVVLEKYWMKMGKCYSLKKEAIIRPKTYTQNLAVNVTLTSNVSFD